MWFREFASTEFRKTTPDGTLEHWRITFCREWACFLSFAIICVTCWLHSALARLSVVGPFRPRPYNFIATLFDCNNMLSRLFKKEIRLLRFKRRTKYMEKFWGSFLKFSVSSDCPLVDIRRATFLCHSNRTIVIVVWLETFLPTLLFMAFAINHRKNICSPFRWLSAICHIVHFKAKNLRCSIYINRNCTIIS